MSRIWLDQYERKIIHLEDEFLSEQDCQYFIEYFCSHEKDMRYYRGNSTFILNGLPIYKDDKVMNTTVNRVTEICKSFESNIRLDNLQLVRWPVGSSMAPHYDRNDTFAAMVYLNNDFVGGETSFDHPYQMNVKPDIGKLIIFSNSRYRHYVSNVKKGTRYTFAFWYTSDTDK